MIRLMHLLLPLIFMSCQEQEEPQIKEPVDPPAMEWKLVWQDEFNYTGLPDKQKWSYETGFIRNQEEQYYTDRAENAYVENGVLTITARKEQYANQAYVPGSSAWKTAKEYAEYTSAALITKGRASWTYGKMEIKAKLPRGTGVWPAIWTLGTNINEVGWPKCGEIDIMEHVGKEPEKVHANFHYQDPNTGEHTSDGKSIDISNPYDEFHIYSIEWNASKIKTYLDGELYHSFNISKASKGNYNPFRNPHYLLINLALGGSWGGAIDDQVFPVNYIIEYVRVYQWQEAEE